MDTHSLVPREGDSIIAGAPGPGQQARLVLGDEKWAHYEFKVQGTLVEGSNLQIHFGISEDGQDYYLLDFLSGWQALSISRMEDGEFAKLDVVNFVSRRGQEYDIVIRKSATTTDIEGLYSRKVRREESKPSC